MSAPRRRRWMDMFQKTTGAIAGIGARSPSALDDAALWNAHDQASRSLEDASARAERVAATMARQRAAIEGVAEKASLVAARSEGFSASAARVIESFERLGVVALNAGLEGARVPEPQGRALLLLSEELRANVRRGADAAEQLTRAVDEIVGEAAEVRRQLEQSRTDLGEVAQQSAGLQASTQQATRSLGDLAVRLHRATGVDPETARVVSLAGEHARGLMTALSTLASAPRREPALGALRPMLGPLAQLLGEIEVAVGGEGRGGAEGDP